MPFQNIAPVIVFHSITELGKVLEVTLETTGNLTDPEGGKAYITVADFTIQHNDEKFTFKDFSSVTPGNFVFKNIVPQPGDFIRIEIITDQFDQCHTEFFIPETASANIKEIKVDESTAQPIVNAGITLTSNSDACGYIIYSKGMIHNEETGAVEEVRFRLSSIDRGIDERMAGDFSQNSNILFVQPSIAPSREINISIDNIPSSFNAGNPKESVYVVVEQVSQDLYEYYLSLEMANILDPDRTSQEPFNIHSNVNGGIGIFGSRSVSELLIQW